MARTRRISTAATLAIWAASGAALTATARPRAALAQGTPTTAPAAVPTPAGPDRAPAELADAETRALAEALEGPTNDTTAVGYAGGKTDHPTYEDVCSHTTGHAEVVQVVFDPQRVSYQKLLEVFFENHDPTTVDRQGPDYGDQYRSVVFYENDEQKQLATAEKAKRDASGEYVGPIVTKIDPAPTFWKAEGYHQQYFEKQGVNYVCHTGNGKKRKVAL